MRTWVKVSAVIGSHASAFAAAAELVPGAATAAAVFAAVPFALFAVVLVAFALLLLLLLFLSASLACVLAKTLLLMLVVESFVASSAEPALSKALALVVLLVGALRVVVRAARPSKGFPQTRQHTTRELVQPATALPFVEIKTLLLLSACVL